MGPQQSTTPALQIDHHGYLSLPHSSRPARRPPRQHRKAHRRHGQHDLCPRQGHPSRPAIRLRRPRASHLRSDHGAAPLQAPPNICQRPELRRRGYCEAKAKGDDAAAAAQAPLLNFHGGGHLNHSLFWENLAPNGKGGGGAPEGKLLTAIEEDFGSFDNLKKQANTALAGIQGSGWAWLVKDKTSGTLGLVTRMGQDPVTGNLEPLMGIDAWEHAYYLQYQNRKAEYFSAIWDVINWGTVAKRFEK